MADDSCVNIFTDSERGSVNHDRAIETGSEAEAGAASQVEAESINQGTSLHRDLQARHITMIAIGGALGTGLLVGTGEALAMAGPAAVLITYALLGLLVYVVMTAVAEMAAWIPISGFSGYATRFCHPSLGFCIGWTYWFKYIIVTPNQLTAGALVMEYWISREKVNPGAFILIFLIVIVSINYFGVRFFGEFEFWLSGFKIIALVTLIIITMVIACGGADGEARGFKYWKDPGAFADHKEWGFSPAVERFLTFWSTIVMAAFAFIGSELIGVTVGEAQNPRRTIPRAIKMTFFRIVFFYCLSVFLLGMCVPYNSPDLTFANPTQRRGASASPFVVAMKLAGIKVLPDLVNAFIVVFIFSAANSDLYIASRSLYGLAADGHAPAIFKKTNSKGVPVYALGLSSIFGLLAFTTVARNSQDVFKKFVNLTTVFGLLTWIGILITHISFLRARGVRGITKAEMAYVAPFGLWGSYIALGFCCLITLTKHLTAFLDVRRYWVNIVTGYVGIPIFVAMFAVHKFWKKTRRVPPLEADFYTGKDAIDREEAQFLAEQEKKREKEEPSFWGQLYHRYVAWLF